MSKYDVVDCPKCGKHDFVLKPDDHWVCLNPDCNFTEEMPRSNSETDISFGSLLLAGFITALILFGMLAL
jgi:ssDNA-binding Zn-finger/Zn-ribbon topoisomerase 1